MAIMKVLLSLVEEPTHILRPVDKDGERYKVQSKVLMPKHTIQFAVKFPRTEQVFRGWMFTGTGLAITGWSKLQDREAGFYATRVEE